MDGSFTPVDGIRVLLVSAAQGATQLKDTRNRRCVPGFFCLVLPFCVKRPASELEAWEKKMCFVNLFLLEYALDGKR